MITIFVGTCDRIDTLQRSVAAYKKFRTPHEIVIVDNGTTHSACVKVLDRLERKVKRIYRLPGCDSMFEATENFNIAIRDQYDTGDAGEWFAVSEADVCFEGTDPRALKAYLRVAQETGYAAGPHLRVDQNIPRGYPLRSRVLACETWMLYRRDMEWAGDIPWSRTQIDTTFHLFPATRRFNRLSMDPARVGPPYDAMHLDWYLNVHAPTRENGVYVNGERPVGSWGKAWIRDYWGWVQTYGADVAFDLLMREPEHDTDICNVSFIRSWALQFGVGCDIDFDASERHLRRALLHAGDRYWSLEDDWMRAVYANDLSPLGWDA